MQLTKPPFAPLWRISHRPLVPSRSLAPLDEGPRGECGAHARLGRRWRQPPRRPRRQLGRGRQRGRRRGSRRPRESARERGPRRRRRQEGRCFRPRRPRKPARLARRGQRHRRAAARPHRAPLGGGRGGSRRAVAAARRARLAAALAAPCAMGPAVGPQQVNVETHGTAVWLRAASGGGGGEGALGGGGGGLAAASASTAAATASAPPVSATWTAAGSAAVAALGGDGAGKGDDGSMRRPNRRSMKAPKVAEGTYQLDIMAAVSGACKGCGQPKAAHIGAAFTCPVVASSAGSSERNAGVSGAMGARSRGRMEDTPDVATATAPLARPPLRGGANDMWL